jgi:23S rRNA (pseudouridine1915-N3)-methyltransferase
MKFQLLSIGKSHDENLKTSIDDFTKRISNYYKTDWLIIPPLKNAASLSTNNLKDLEAQALLSKINKDDFLVLLD